MLKDLISKITGSRIFCVIVAVLVAMFIWLYVVSVENPSIESTISDIPVTFVGADDILADRKLMVKDSKDASVTLKLMGKRLDLAKLNRDNISITVDLKDIKNTGEVEKLYTIKFPSSVSENDVYVLDKSPAAITVNIDKLIEKEIPVSATHVGNVLEGFMSETIECTPQTVLISGPEEFVSQIKEAKIVIERENVDKTIDADMPFDLVNADGEKIASDEISLSTEVVNVVLPIVTVKEIPIYVEYIPGGGATRDNTKQTLSVEKITLAGDASILDEINTLTVGPIDLASFISTTTVTLPLPVPNGVENLTGVSEVTVKVEIKGLEYTKLSVTNITAINAPAGYYPSLVTQSLDIAIRAPEDVIDLIPATSIRITADLSELGNGDGIYTVPAKVSIAGYGDAGVVGEYKVVVSLSDTPPED